MGLAQLIKGIHVNKEYPRFSRQIVLPDGGAGAGDGHGKQLKAAVATCTYGDWADIAATTDITTDTLIVGIALDTPSAATVYTVDIGLTYIVLLNTNFVDAADIKAKVLAGTITSNELVHRAEVRLEVATRTAGAIDPIMLPFPIYVLNGVGILGRVKTLLGAENTIQASVLCLQCFE